MMRIASSVRRAALPEGHPGRLELARLVDADADGRQHAPVREVVDHRDLAGGHDRRSGTGVMSTLGPNLSRRGPRGHGRHRGHGLGHRQRRGQPLREPDGVDLAPLAQLDEPPEEVAPAGPDGHGPGITPMRYLMRMAATLPPSPGGAGQPAYAGGLRVATFTHSAGNAYPSPDRNG